MKSFLFYAALLFTIFSCSNDDSRQTNLEQFSINGKFLAPNNLDPISKANVRAYSNNELKGQSTTDAQGNYTIMLNEGDYDLVLNKGKFKTEKNLRVDSDLILDNLSIETLPTIAVVTGYYDNIESVLYDIGLYNPISAEPLFDIIEGNDGVNRLDHGRHGDHNAMNPSERNSFLAPNVDFHFGDLMDDPVLLDTYDIIFLNCGLSEALKDNSSVLTNYVSNGGILYATDWASVYLESITNDGTNYLTPYSPEKSGVSTATVATILDENLSDWLLLNFNISIGNTVEIDDFLNSWQVIDSYDAATTVSWLNGPVTYWDDNGNEISDNKDLAFTFLHGNGAVFYSSFHTENNEVDDFSDVDRIMQYLVFEMSDLQ